MSAKATLLLAVLAAMAGLSAAVGGECIDESRGRCHNPSAALRLKLIAIASILVASFIGVCLPLFARKVPALDPSSKLFALVKAFSSGVILATGYMHVLPDSFDDLQSPCLPDHPWREFPFTTFVAMVSAVLTLMVDSFATSMHMRVGAVEVATDSHVKNKDEDALSVVVVEELSDKLPAVKENNQQLLRNRIVAQVLELGIVVHSVVIGLSLGASQNPCTIRPLVAALCFHQLFEGMGLGGCILQAEYGIKAKAIMSFFFSTTTPFGVALGIGLSNVYKSDSPTSLIVEGILNAVSAGLLNYMALVDLLAADFLGPRMQANMKLQFQAYMAVLLGAGAMSLMAKWA